MSSRNTHWNNLPQIDGTWFYNQSLILYNSQYDESGLSVNYNSVGDSTEWTNLDLL